MTSGKGGVGKAFVTTNPAVPLARQGMAMRLRAGRPQPLASCPRISSRSLP